MRQDVEIIRGTSNTFRITVADAAEGQKAGLEDVFVQAE